jgi:hypothetical protein
MRSPAAGREEVLEPGIVAVAVRILRQGFVTEHRGQVGIELGEWRADRLVLNIVQMIVGLSSAQIDADLLLHDRQVVGQDRHFDAGQIGEGLDVVADREGRWRILRHEHQLGTGILFPFGVIGRGGLHAAAGHRGTEAQRHRTHAKGRGRTTTEFKELPAADALVDSIFRYRKHARLLPYWFSCSCRSNS